MEGGFGYEAYVMAYKIPGYCIHVAKLVRGVRRLRFGSAGRPAPKARSGESYTRLEKANLFC